ncbi:MAG: DUF2628 domain-containing protein [Methylobacterium sp.]|nr:DUF2628 domain-containing protein [Methylobacterium sp.]
MARYTVHVKGEGPDALARAQFVRDGFSWAALAFGPFWLFAKGAWISALLLIALLMGMAMLLGSIGIAVMFPLVSQLVYFLVALESGAIRAWELELKGHRFAGVISGDDRDVMERRFFEEALGEAAAPAPVSLPYPSENAPRATSGLPIIGLFPNPSRPRGNRP